MRMNHSADHTERRDFELESSEQQLSVSHLVNVIRAYMPVILISMLSVAIGYAVCAILVYIVSPAQRTTEQPFRLEFRGATEGRLPNGVKFSAAEILGTPILLRVYQNDELARFTTFSDFVRSTFVL